MDKNNDHVLIADDHEIIRYGLRSLIEANIPGSGVTEAESYETLTSILRQKTFTHLVLDLQLADINIIEKFPVIREKYPHMRIMAYGMFNEMIYTKLLLNMGADGFLHKECTQAETIFALQQFLATGFYISPRIILHQLSPDHDDVSSYNPFLRLSFKEMQMANLILHGESAKQIQYSMQLKSSTVSTLKTRIFGKLQVGNIIELVKLAATHSII
jgi:two-component system invasion response regulator UvrY